MQSSYVNFILVAPPPLYSNDFKIPTNNSTLITNRVWLIANHTVLSKIKFNFGGGEFHVAPHSLCPTDFKIPPINCKLIANFLTNFSNFLAIPHQPSYYGNILKLVGQRRERANSYTSLLHVTDNTQ